MLEANNEVRFNKSVYTDIDSLFDTRLPVLNNISHVISGKVLKDGSYFTRVKEQFDIIGGDIFTPLYEQRNKLVLPFALLTHIVDIIRVKVVEVISDISNMGNLDNLSLYINTYPYKLNLVEVESIKETIGMLVNDINIKMIYIPNDELTPEWIEEHVDLVIKYDGISWLEHNTKNLNLIRKPLLSTVFIVPALVDNAVPNKEVTDEMFKVAMAHMRMVADVQYINIEYFCLKRKEKKKT